MAQADDQAAIEDRDRKYKGAIAWLEEHVRALRAGELHINELVYTRDTVTKDGVVSKANTFTLTLHLCDAQPKNGEEV